MRLIHSSYRILIVLFAGLILISSSVTAQDQISYSEKVLSEDQIKDLRDLSQYPKTESKLRLKEIERDKRESTAIPETDFDFGIGPIIQALTYLLIGSLVIFILYLIFSGIKVDRKIKGEIAPEIEEIEDIEVIDAESGLEMALKAENYRDAVRMLFIKLLQVLVLEKSIKWKPETTNRHYLKEMKNHPKIQHFSNLVMAYERIWYGSEPIDKLFFEFLKADFDKFYSTENLDINVEE